jgi:hypothetical protein
LLISSAILSAPAASRCRKPLFCICGSSFHVSSRWAPYQTVVRCPLAQPQSWFF